MNRMFSCLEFLKKVGRDSSGQSLVETSLVFPILLTFLIGGAELARVERAAIAVSNAAKAGVQYAIQNGYTAQDTSSTGGIATAAAAEAGGLPITTTASSTLLCSDGSTYDSTTLCPNAHIEQAVTVNTSITITPTIRLPILPATWTVKGQAIEKCAQ